MRTHVNIDERTLGGELAGLAADQRRLSRLLVSTLDGVAEVVVASWRTARGGLGYAEAVETVTAACCGGGGGLRRAARIMGDAAEPGVMSAIGLVAELAEDIGADSGAGVGALCSWLEAAAGLRMGRRDDG